MGTVKDTLIDLRERLDAAEERIETIEAEDESAATGWPEASCWIAFWAMCAVIALAGAYASVREHPEPVRPDASVECVKAGGEWSWHACRKAPVASAK